MVEPGQIAVGAVAAELGAELQAVDAGAGAAGHVLDLQHGADVAPGHTLVLVQEEHAALGGADHLQDLMLALVAVEAGLDVEAMGLVHDERVEQVRLAVHERARPGEQVADAALGHGARELGLVDGARRRVAGHVAGVELLLDEADQQVDGHHGLAGARPALHDQHVLVLRRRAPGQVQGGLVDHLLVVDHEEGLVAGQHGAELVRQVLGRPDAAVLDDVEQLPAVAAPDEALDEVRQALGVVAQEDRGAGEVGLIARIQHGGAVGHVVQVGAGREADG